MSEREAALQGLRKELQEQRAELVSRVEAIAADIRQENHERSDDWDDRAVENENDEVLAQLDDAGREQVEQIDVALARMSEGTYGVCIDCDEEIPMARLRALPSALRCVQCESAHENA